MIIFVVLWKTGLLFKQLDQSETEPNGLWDRQRALLSPSPGSITLGGVIDVSQLGCGSGCSRTQALIVMDTAIVLENREVACFLEHSCPASNRSDAGVAVFGKA